MINRKRTLLLTVLSLFACFAIPMLVINSSPRDVIDEAKLVYYGKADDVINDSVLIIQAKKIGETQKTYLLENDLSDSFTLSTVKVESLYSNTSAVEIKPGNEIIILESQWTDEENKIIHHTEGYIKMELGKEYLLLLGYNASVDNYYPTGLLYGKVPLDIKEKLFLVDQHEQIKGVIEEIRKRYIK